MNQGYWTSERITGGFLLGSLLVLVVAAGVMITSGATPGFRAMLQGDLIKAAPYAASSRREILLFVIGWIIQLIGLALLARLLQRAGQDQLAVLSITLILVAVIIAILNYTFRMTVELWAAQEAARTGSIPGLLEPLKTWLSNAFSLGYRAHFVAMAGIGWALMRSGIAAPWVGPVTLAWSLFFLISALIGFGIPALPFIMPAVIGIALLRG